MRDSAAYAGERLLIRPSPPWRTVDLRELWRYRELLFFLVWRDVKVRYKQTFMGMAWAIIQPLMATILFAFFFGRIAKLPSDGIPYPLFAYAGLLPWTFFAGAVTNGSNSLVGSTHLITKVYFPRLLLPLAAIVTVLFDFFVALLMLGPLLVWKRVTPSPAALVWVPLVMFVAVLLAAGLSIWLSALVARFRDLRHVIPFLVQIWMFGTPIVYPLSFVPERWRWLVSLNPMTGVVEAFRGAVFGRPFAVVPLVYAAVLAVVLIATGSIYFRRLERMVADVI
jgi:lipopolysaccharide transport system permease protein